MQKYRKCNANYRKYAMQTIENAIQTVENYGLGIPHIMYTIMSLKQGWIKIKINL